MNTALELEDEKDTDMCIPYAYFACKPPANPRSARALVFCVAVCCRMAPRRLRIDGSRILSPQGEPLRLRGFNIMYMLDTEFKLPRDDMDGEIRRRLPGTNVLRLVILHWDDKPTTNSGKDSSNDCSQTTGGQPISQRCLRQIDSVLQWAAGQGLWTILTARASLAAGEAVNGRVGPTLFDDAALRRRFLSMWSVVAERYKNYDMIAGYEPLSEPRVTTNRDRVRAFYAEACQTVWAHDSPAPCFVGPAPFYDRANIEESLLAGTANRVVYNFNFFAPVGFVAGESFQYESRKWRVIEYPGPMPCCHVHDKSHAKCCRGQCCDANVHTDRSTLDDELQAPLTFSKKHAVPVMMDQWGVMRDHPRAASQTKYLLDMMVLLEKYQLHWTYWQWRHRADRQYAIMTLREGKPQLAEQIVDRLRLALGPPSVVYGSRCYAERYPDLLKGFCGGEIEHCNWPDLLCHWEEHGKAEGRVYDCGGQQQVAAAQSPPPPPPPVRVVPAKVISPPPPIAQPWPTRVTPPLQSSSPPPPPPAKALVVTFLAASPPLPRHPQRDCSSSSHSSSLNLNLTSSWWRSHHCQRRRRRRSQSSSLRPRRPTEPSRPSLDTPKDLPVRPQAPRLPGCRATVNDFSPWQR